MKATLCVLSVLFVLPSAFGQRSKVRELLLSRYHPSGKTVAVVQSFDFKLDAFSERNLVEKFSRGEPDDFISAGLRAIESNFDSPDFVASGLSWRPDDATTFRLKSKLTYKYSPRVFPKDPMIVIDEAVFRPMRLIATKALGF